MQNNLFRNTPFYFLRHALTDHNVHQVYDDQKEVAINETGMQQALRLQEAIVDLPITTVCSSPLLRVQQTKEIVLKNKEFKDVIVDDLRECKSALWRLFLSLESTSLTEKEWGEIHGFLERTSRGLETVFKEEDPLLVIAHGGTYWAIAHLLGIEGSRRMDNCVLTEIFPEKNNWRARALYV